MKIIVAGGSGFVGRALTDALLRESHEVVVLSRSQRAPNSVAWDPTQPPGSWAEQLRGAGAVVNLSGASIGGGRWTRSRKEMLVTSRTASTDTLVQAVAGLAEAQRPRVFVTASGIDYYGNHPGDEVLDEQAKPGTSFLAELCVQWEAAAQKAEGLGLRVVRMRTAFCIGRDAPALRLLVLPFRLFAGGPVGSGRQWFTWIHLDDLVALYVLALEREDISGPLNAVAPSVVRERDVAVAIGRLLHRPAFVPAPEFMLRLVLGEMADLLLHGRNAAPAKAQAVGYAFRYADVSQALAQALRRRG